ncbi:MAG: hypothetical protein HC880_06835 [Bacteroidia bacterium]|nr:hypothetical protein [Bacteroidia bacterium]
MPTQVFSIFLSLLIVVSAGSCYKKTYPQALTQSRMVVPSDVDARLNPAPSETPSFDNPLLRQRWQVYDQPQDWPVVSPRDRNEGGFTYTQKELSEWRQRAEQGPYRTNGDTHGNGYIYHGNYTPNDWERIVKYKNEFMAQPDVYFNVAGKADIGCIEAEKTYWTRESIEQEPIKVLSAAFYALVKDDRTVMEAVKANILRLVRNRGLDFYNTAVWCEGAGRDNVANFWLSTLPMVTIRCFDYSYEVWSDQERSQYRYWLKGLCYYLAREVNQNLSTMILNRDINHPIPLEQYRIKDAEKCDQVPYRDALPIHRLSRYYNNRRSWMSAAAGMGGVLLKDRFLINSTKLFARELLAFFFYPDGTFMEHHRGDAKLPSRGLAYAANTLGYVFQFGDMLAKSGDPDVFAYQTSFGVCATKGAVVKSYQWAILQYYKHLRREIRVYCLSCPPNPENLIDGEHPDWHSFHDDLFIVANCYYKDKEIRNAYLRLSDDLQHLAFTRQLAYLEVASNGPNSIWTGPGILPGAFFMYGQMEYKAY